MTSRYIKEDFGFTDTTPSDLARVTTERDTLIRQRAADVEALNAVQALHAQAVAERDEARRQVDAMMAVVSSAEAIANADGSFTHYLNALRRNLDALRGIAVPSTNGGG